MALYNTPWGVRELPDDEVIQLRGQVGADGITEHTEQPTSPGVSSVEGPNPTPEGE